MNFYDRTELLIGEEGYNVIKNSHVAVFGVGGVGGFCVEALCRSGIGEITVFDNDVVSVTNINRQIIANQKNVGESKVEEIKKRILEINPQCIVHANNVFYLKENASSYDFSSFDYVVDAVDTISAKLEIIERAKSQNVPVISCMGTGGKIDLTALKVADISDTKACPLARVIRRELKARNVVNVKVVYSEEDPVKRMDMEKSSQPSMIFVPATAGLLLAETVIKDILKSDKQ